MFRYQWFVDPPGKLACLCQWHHLRRRDCQHGGAARPISLKRPRSATEKVANDGAALQKAQKEAQKAEGGRGEKVARPAGEPSTERTPRQIGITRSGRVFSLSDDRVKVGRRIPGLEPSLPTQPSRAQTQRYGSGVKGQRNNTALAAGGTVA